jgi:WD40 repeat protein
MNKVGRMIAAAMQDRTIRLFDARSCEEIQKMTDAFLCTSIAFSPRGDVLASGGVDHIVKIWDIRTGKLLSKLEGHTYPVLTLAFSPDGSRLVSGSGDTTLIVWDLDKRSKLHQLKGHSLYVVTCDWDPKRERIVSGGVDSTVRVWDSTTGKMTAKIEDHRTAVHAVRFSHDGSVLASGSSDQTIILWDSAGDALKQENVLHGHSGEVRSLAFSADNKYLASGSSEKELLVWSTEKRVIEGRGSALGEIDGIEWYPSETAFLTSDGSGAITQWSVMDLAAVMVPLESLLKEIEADTKHNRTEELTRKFEEMRSQYDDEMLRDKRLFYVVWQCKKALGLLKGKTKS